MSEKPRKIHCPQCGKATLYHPDNAYRPFCSSRCRLIDLGQWAEESYRITADPIPFDHDSVI